MDKHPARQIRLDGDDASRAQSMGEDVTRALSAVEEMVRSRLGDAAGGDTQAGDAQGSNGENRKSIVAIRVFNNDKDVFSDGSTFCGVYDYTAQVCRDCNDDEWALAAQAAEQAGHL